MSDASAAAVSARRKRDSPRGSAPVRRTFLGMVGMRLLGQWGVRIGLAWIAIVAFFAVVAPFVASSFPILMKTSRGWSSPMLAHLTPVDVILPVISIAGIIIACVRDWTVGRKLAAFTWVVAAAIGACSWPDYVRGWPDAVSQYGLGTAIVFTSVLCLVLLAAILVIPLRCRASARAKLAVGLPMVVIAALLAVFPVLPSRVVVYEQYRDLMASGAATHVIFTLIPYSPTDRLRDSELDTRLLAPGYSFSREQIRDAVRQAAEADLPPDEAHDKKLIMALVDDAFAKAKRVKEHQATPSSLGPAAQPDVKNKRADARMIRLAAIKPDQQFHAMGTTAYGEDLASRMIHACRIAMSIGFISTGIALAIGITLGGLMGYFSGIVDLIGMRIVEVFNAIPTIFLLIAIVAFYGRNLYLIMAIIGLTGWVGYTLFVRAEFLRLRDQDFVQAARAQAIPLWSILFKHLLPNGVAPVVVTASFGIASAILAEATLSFLGLGLVDQPSWGQMLNEARGVGTSFYWWIALYPGLAIFLTVFAYNLVGEGLRDAIDPHVVREEK